LDGKPAPGNPTFGKSGAATIPLIDPPRDTEAAKTAKVVSTYTFPGPNLTPAEIWASGVRTPYGLAFSPTGELWEVEHGPRGGDKTAERWEVGHRLRDVEQGPDGSLWMLEDANPGALIHVTPK